MKKRGLLILATCIMAAGVLAGCGSGKGQAVNTSQAVEAETEPESETAGSSAEEEKTSEEASTVETNATKDSTEGADSVDRKTLIVYFSASGNTGRVAEVIAGATEGELFELVPVEPYEDEDLDWTDDNSRVSVEHENPEQRDVELVSNTVEGWSDISVVYIGYPIWWGEAAWPVDSFVKSNDFTGKTVIPFCTSASSGLGKSGELLAEMAGTGEWLEGIRFQSGVSEEDVVAWVESLALN